MQTFINLRKEVCSRVVSFTNQIESAYLCKVTDKSSNTKNIHSIWINHAKHCYEHTDEYKAMKNNIIAAKHWKTKHFCSIDIVLKSCAWSRIMGSCQWTMSGLGARCALRVRLSCRGWKKSRRLASRLKPALFVVRFRLSATCFKYMYFEALQCNYYIIWVLGFFRVFLLFCKSQTHCVELECSRDEAKFSNLSGTVTFNIS